MEKKIDELLYEVLTPDYAPGDVLNRRVINQVKEKRKMKFSKIGIAVLAGTLAAATSVSAFAAYRYLNPKDIADKMGDEKLAVNFDEWGADTNLNSITVTDAGYKVTLLGCLSGEDLSEYQTKMNDIVLSDRSYFAVAIEREDGTPLEAWSDQYFVSPLVGTLDPFHYNVASWGGSYGEFTEDGVLYRLVEAANVEYFADQNLYLCVSDTSFISPDQFVWNEEAGTIAAKDEYNGLNVLLELSVDPVKANPAKAAEFLKQMESIQENDEEVPVTEFERDMESFMAKLTPENIDEFCVRMENTVETVSPDKDGYVKFSPWLVNEKVSDTRGGDGGKLKVDWYFEKPGMVISGISGSDSSMEDVVITTYTLNEDGTVTFAAYVPREFSCYLDQ